MLLCAAHLSPTRIIAETWQGGTRHSIHVHRCGQQQRSTARVFVRVWTCFLWSGLARSWSLRAVTFLDLVEHGILLALISLGRSLSVTGGGAILRLQCLCTLFTHKLFGANVHQQKKNGSEHPAIVIVCARRSESSLAQSRPRALQRCSSALHLNIACLCLSTTTTHCSYGHSDPSCRSSST